MANVAVCGAIDAMQSMVCTPRTKQRTCAQSPRARRHSSALEGHFLPLVEAACPISLVLKPIAPPPKVLSEQGELKRSSSLAARRRKVSVRPSVNSGPTEIDCHVQDKSASNERSSEKKRILGIDSIALHYMLGSEVMPTMSRGMVVLHAKRVVDGIDVVIKKRVKAECFRKGGERDWRRNTEMMMNLPAHANIAQVYEVLEDEDCYYVVMEKCEGMDLFEVVHQNGVGPLSDTKAILRKLLQGVHELHSRGCVHKDLKMENVVVGKGTEPSSPNAMTPTPPSDPKPMSPKLLSRLRKPSSKPSCQIDGEAESVQENPEAEESLGPQPIVKLIDFDTVVRYDSSSPQVARSVVGTDQYIAPEAYAGQYSPASDMFSVGVMAYKLICGKLPFTKSMFEAKPGEFYVGSASMIEIRQNLLKFQIDWSREPWQAEPEARDFTKWLLQSIPAYRPTASEALEHVFLAQSGLPAALPQGHWGSRRRGKTNQMETPMEASSIGGA